MFQNVNSFFQLNLSSFAGVDGWHSCRQCAACWQVGNPHAGSFINAALCKISGLHILENVIFKFSQDGEGEVGVAQGSDDCLQCSQVCYKFEWNWISVQHCHVFHPQGGQGQERDWPQEYEQVDRVIIFEVEGISCILWWTWKLEASIGVHCSIAEFPWNKSSHKPNHVTGLLFPNRPFHV